VTTTNSLIPTPPFFDAFATHNQPIGRFAPSPTGSLHFGSLIAAVASYLYARQQKGKWLVRIEDVDTQRCNEKASISIIKTLEAYDFEWDGEIIYQTQRNDAYQVALDSIKEYTYPCSCTRKKLLATAPAGKFGYIYPEFCRNGVMNSDRANKNHLSIRLKTNADRVCFEDQCQKGRFCQNINEDIGDFILKRGDGLFAYQLAVVVDDAWQGISQIVRGADLYDNTPRQIYLQKILGYPQPDYLHFPVAIDRSGRKLSKQSLSPEILLTGKRANLIKALDFLGQAPPLIDHFSSLNDLWSWAFKNWNTSKIPKQMTQVI